MTGKEIVDIFNSATTFGILVAIFVSIWVLIVKKDQHSKSSRR